MRGTVFVVADMQDFCNSDGHRCEPLGAIARDRDVQQLTFGGSMNKQLVTAKPFVSFLTSSSVRC